MTFRKPLTITGRSSSITNSFVQAIIPSIEPTIVEVDEALAVLGMRRDGRTCVYCGAHATDWDHLRPLVKGRRPTGYINEIRNLVPSCGPCNQSKGGADWRKWMQGTAKGSPKTRGIADLQERIRRLEAFERWGNVRPLVMVEMADPDEWERYWTLLAEIDEHLRRAQDHAQLVRNRIFASVQNRRKKEHFVQMGQLPRDGTKSNDTEAQFLEDAIADRGRD